MTKRDFLSVGLKITGVILIIAILSTLPYVVYMTKGWNTLLMLWIPYISLALGSLYLIKTGSNEIAAKLVPIDKKLMVTGINDFPRELFVLVLRIEGIFNIIGAVTYITNQLLMQPDKFDLSKVSTFVLLIICSVYLCAGAGYLTKLAFPKFRTGNNQQIEIKQPE
jgi:hypothetical protein